MATKIDKRTVDAAAPQDKPYFLWDKDLTGFGLKVNPGGRKTYVFQYRKSQAGGRRREPRMTIGKHGDLTPAQARKIAADLMVRVLSGADPAAEATTGGEAPTVAKLARRFLDEYLPSKKKTPRERTLDSYESLFRVHILPALGEKSVDAVTTDDVERLHARMRDTPYVANRALSLIQYAFDQAERWGYRPQNTNPALHIDRYPEEKRGDKKEVMLSPAQMGGFLAAVDEIEAKEANPYACAALRLLFWTGWRKGEVLRLRWENVNLKAGYAKLVKTKTSREEYRQLPAEAIEVLSGLTRLADCPYVFPGRDGKGHLTNLKRAWRRTRKKAGLEDLPGIGAFRLHDLRHNVVSQDVSRGVPLEIAGRNVGHRSRRSTEVYAHFAPDALKRAADERARAMRQAVEAAARRSSTRG